MFTVVVYLKNVLTVEPAELLDNLRGGDNFIHFLITSLILSLNRLEMKSVAPLLLVGLCGVLHRLGVSVAAVFGLPFLELSGEVLFP